MTDEKEALEWLEGAIAGRWDFGSVGTARWVTKHARTLKRLLAEPRMPEEPSDEILTIMREAPLKSGDADDDCQPEWGKRIMRASYRALRSHLTKPATKEVEVWHVEYAGSHGEPGINVKSCRVLADDEADRLRVVGCSCIRVTGPHKQQVPVA